MVDTTFPNYDDLNTLIRFREISHNFPRFDDPAFWSTPEFDVATAILLTAPVIQKALKIKFISIAVDLI